MSSLSSHSSTSPSAQRVRQKRKRIFFADEEGVIPESTGNNGDTNNNDANNNTTEMMQVDSDPIIESPPSESAPKRRKYRDDEVLQVDMILARQQQHHATLSTSSNNNAHGPGGDIYEATDERNLRPSDDRVPMESDVNIVVHDVIRRYWGLKPDSAPYNPSPNPVSITRCDLPKLRANEYVVTEKSDGIRYLLILCRHPQTQQNIAVMMDRACRKYAVGIVAEEIYFDGSIFDGELVWNADGRLVYLIFDVVACRGRDVRQCPYNERSAVIRECFSDPGNYPVLEPSAQLSYAQDLAARGKIVAIDGCNFLCMQPKPCYQISYIDILWNKIQSRQFIGHANDGLILTPVREAVGCRTHWSQFKWKPHHTIDLQLRLAYLPINTPVQSSSPSSSATIDGSFVSTPATKQWVAALFFGDDRNLSDQVVVSQLPLENACRGVEYNGRVVKFTLTNNSKLQRIQEHLLQMQVYAFACIVECSAQFYPGNLQVLTCTVERIRTDKTVPNNHYTVLQTLKNIEENISMDELVHVIGQQQQQHHHPYSTPLVSSKYSSVSPIVPVGYVDSMELSSSAAASSPQSSTDIYPSWTRQNVLLDRWMSNHSISTDQNEGLAFANTPVPAWLTQDNQQEQFYAASMPM